MHRRYRLGSSSLIRRVHAEGTRVRSGSVAVTGLIRDGGQPQIAIIATRRVGNAVARNRARRRLRAALQRQIPSMKPGAAAVVAATPATGTESFQVLEKDLSSALARAGLKVEPSV